jgi:NAD(P)-dependent dehydrogenase (short-subunit alcohol dehydrogenase family)
MQAVALDTAQAEKETIVKKHYLVTGASSGLGRHIAEHFMAQKDRVSVLTTSNSLVALPAVDLAMKLGTTFESIRNQIKAATSGGAVPLDGIIHCAGGAHVAPARLVNDDAYDWTMNAARIAFALISAAGQAGVMAKGGSSLVLMSSVAARSGVGGMVSYSASKGSIEAMARSAAVELAPRSIRVNCVAAGAFKSPMHNRIVEPMTSESVIAYERMHPLGFGEIEDVAQAIYYLMGAKWVTGTTLVVDGGFSA